MSDRIPSQDASAVLLSVTQSIVVFTALLPPFAEVRKADKSDPVAVADVRLGEAVSAGLVIATGITASAVVNSPLPAAASVIAALVLVGLYESVLSQ